MQSYLTASIKKGGRRNPALQRLARSIMPLKKARPQ